MRPKVAVYQIFIASYPHSNFDKFAYSLMFAVYEVKK